ncbi:hypothetical protein ATANTOWER_020771 [Ataeniobius toweri]|uniref:FAM171 N-terminal domain-containing protein n=1 Tax=Ataeniobius toweri TaxID=208326 RepID=A0ABU7CHQ8_9TELE|nr:hypothetical protein [Ataeniobius toweri]
MKIIKWERKNSVLGCLRGQPSIHFLRRALSLPADTSFANLTALLTVASSPSRIQHFPHLQILGSNSTGTEKKFELTPVAAISVHLLASDGAELQVNGPITFSVPLPVDSSLKENDHIPAWRFDPRLEKGLRDAIAGKGLDCQSIRLHSPQYPLRTFRERISFGLCLWCRNALRYRIALC